jgi:hypothetical protein
VPRFRHIVNAFVTTVSLSYRAPFPIVKRRFSVPTDLTRFLLHPSPHQQRAGKARASQQMSAPVAGLSDSTQHAKKWYLRLMRPPENRYAPQAAFCGNIHWRCPGCGHERRLRVDYSSWRIRCSNSKCRRMWCFGLMLHDLSGLRASGRRHTMPRDMMLALGPIELDYRRDNGPVHRLIVGAKDASLVPQDDGERTPLKRDGAA